ncbi:uncharacterized protein LOC126996284 [Eriocheir sinensis]|uniref:uncharacterized protein LOC126996284 n=1 Tax=Eriocheir sinensis TaxID=95602 RepID=UPI0021C92807|nr:uncharacterized protein LOC126996284 [Eriocheir sinensis]
MNRCIPATPCHLSFESRFEIKRTCENQGVRASEGYTEGEGEKFGFRPGRSTSDLLMLLTKIWQDTLTTVVVALDIADAFDRVRHGGLLEKLRAKGIQGDLLQLLGDYLQGRTLQVVVNGEASESHPV